MIDKVSSRFLVLFFFIVLAKQISQTKMKAFNFLWAVLSVLGSFVVFSSPVSAGEETPEWSYGGETNPTRWGELSEEFAACEVGRDQSPIDLNEAVASTPSNISFNYASVPLVVVNNGHTVQVNYPEGSTVSIDGDEYELLQFHFHTPSEHTVEGRAAAMELHFVHSNEAGELAVVGVMLASGESNPVIDTIWAHIPEEEGTNQVESTVINAADLLPGSTAYFGYAGSLTTPPCSEGVRWNILQEPVQVSEEQIDTFEALYQVDARPTQPTNGRIIELHEEN